jgi:error-prone DNA polymerase
MKGKSEDSKIGGRVRLDSSSRMPLPPYGNGSSVASTVPVLPPELSSVLFALGDSIATRRPRYAELVTRSNFSFLRGGSSPEALVEAAKEAGLATVAICDVDGLYGAVRAWEAAKREGIKLILGADLLVSFATEVSVEAVRRVVLLVQNHAGYTHLCELLTLLHEHKLSDERPVLSSQWLRGREEGLLALFFPEPIMGKEAQAQADDRVIAAMLLARFEDRTASVVCLHKDGLDRARVMAALALEKSRLLPVVASNAVLYAKARDKQILDVLTCIREKCTLDDAGQRLLPNTEARIKGETEMLQLFGNYPQWLERSVRLSERCTFSFSELSYSFPCELPEGVTADEELRRQTEEGALQRYRGDVPGSVREQIEKELRLIQKLKVAPYFLSIRGVVQMARARDILCQGRGSAANSAVCFCLGITAVDPARSNLLFERFLSEERHEPPDIDIDFEHERREEVIQDIYAKYSRERAAMVSEVICYRAKSALREVGKVLGFSLEQVGRLSSLVSYWDDVASVTGNAYAARRLREAGFDSDDKRVQLAFNLARAMQGVPRHLSIHVGGFVLSADKLTQIAPIKPATMPGRTVIPWDKDDLEALGFFKVDVLGLGMLTALRKALDLIGDPRGVQTGLCAIDRLARIPAEDARVYDALGKADTVGVFQIESRAQMAMLPRLLPKKFYDLVVEVAIVRPGPIQGGMVHPYLRRRNGEEVIDLPHPCLAPILDRTLGVPLFQEQVMQIAIVGAGYTGGEADQLRRDMAAWKRSTKLDGHRERLHAGFRKRGISEEFSERLFAQIRGFGEYGFPESHAASFALLVYASAWIKVHHPAAFAVALINSQPMGFYSPETILKDAERHGVALLPICGKQSQWEMTIEDDVAEDAFAARGSSVDLAASGPRRPCPEVHATKRQGIRLGFCLISGLQKEVAERVIAVRGEAVTLDALVHLANLGRREREMLAEAGALEAWMPGRKRALWSARSARGDGLFAGLTLEAPLAETTLQMSEREQLVLDYARTGVSPNLQPMKLLRPTMPRNVYSSRDLSMLKKGQRIMTAGMVICRQRPMTASGVVFLTLEDEFGFLNLVLWNRVFEKLRTVVNGQNLLLVTGRVDRMQGERSKDKESEDGPVVETGVGEVSSKAETIHVIVEHVEPLEAGLRALAAKSQAAKRKVAPSGTIRDGSSKGKKESSAAEQRPLTFDSMSRDFH